MNDALLGFRLAVAGGWGRAGLVVAGNALSVAVLVTAAAIVDVVFDPSVGRGESQQRDLALVVVLYLALPVVALLGSVTRLSSGVRDRRLAALHLLGVSRRRTVRIVAAEAGLLATTGAIAGTVLYAYAVRLALLDVDEHWRRWFGGTHLWPSVAGWAVVVAGVPVLSMAVSLAPIGGIVKSPLAVRRAVVPARPGWWRLIPFGAGAAILFVVAVRPLKQDMEISRAHFLVFCAGVILLGLALPLVIPIAVRLTGDVAAGRARRASMLLAARRLQQESATTTRLVAVMAVTIALVCAASCVLVTYEATPQYLAARRAATTGPQAAELSTDGPGVDLSRIHVVGGVHAAVARYYAVQRACTPTEQTAHPVGWGSGCGNLLVGTCADLEAFNGPAPGCRDDQPAWLSTAGQPPPPLTPTARLVHSPAGPFTAAGETFLALPRVGRIDLQAVHDGSWALDAQLFVPVATAGLDRFLPKPDVWTVLLDSGTDAITRLERAVGPSVSVQPEDISELEVVAGYRAVTYGLAGAIVIVCLLALLVTGADAAVQRRRYLAGLAIVGVNPRVLYFSHLLHTAAPLTAAIPTATGTGLLIGVAYLAMAGQRTATPWSTAGVVGVAALVAGALIAVATAAGLGGRVRPADLRHE
ncbi:hypothetical protein ACQP2F_15725 [Actinoplanes sp. CA-030573]|uniref:hypothetical protein n=1 Tax=Actinoplanes sp. CA-030573 TaxID=3239898 RepID=UPI003D900106